MISLLTLILAADILLTRVIDTLSTSIPGVKVVLYEDNTYRFIRNGSAAQMEPPKEWKALPLLIAEDDFHYCIPATGRFNSAFGPRYGRHHEGVDISLNVGTPVCAAFDGTVRISGSMGGYGLVVVILHDNGLETFYGHLSRLNVGVGYSVRAGDIIGMSGNTGRSTGPHLHFETRFKGRPFDPERIFDFSTGKLRDRIFTVRRPFLCITSNFSKDFNPGLFEDGPDGIGNSSAIKARSANKAGLPEIIPSSPEDGVPVYHTVVQGDNLSRLAGKYNTTVKDICSLNEKITPKTVLQLGWEIRVK